jgi:hypothetical protein
MKRRLTDEFFLMLVEHFAIRYDKRILRQFLIKHAHALIDSDGGYLEYLLFILT